MTTYTYTKYSQRFIGWGVFTLLPSNVFVLLSPAVFPLLLISLCRQCCSLMVSETNCERWWLRLDSYVSYIKMHSKTFLKISIWFFLESVFGCCYLEMPFLFSWVHVIKEGKACKNLGIKTKTKRFHFGALLGSKMWFAFLLLSSEWM